MADNADRARELLAASLEHTKGQGKVPAPPPHFDKGDERLEDLDPRDLPKDRDDRSAPKGDVPAGQEGRNPALETRVPRSPAPRANPPGGMELARRAAEGAGLDGKKATGRTSAGKGRSGRS